MLNFWRSPKNILPFAEYKSLMATDLLKANKDCCPKKRGCPQSTPESKKSRRHCSMPQKSCRLDKIGHFPLVDKIRRMCKNERCSGKTNIVCQKCKTNLCLNFKKNCFIQFHDV